MITPIKLVLSLVTGVRMNKQRMEFLDGVKLMFQRIETQPNFGENLTKKTKLVIQAGEIKMRTLIIKN